MKTATLVLGIGALGMSGVFASEVNGVTKDEIRLGSHLDLSGPAANFGVAAADAFRMKADEINNKGGIHGRKIKVIIEDSQYQVPRAVQAANKLINHDGIFAMIGGLGTAMNNAVLPLQLKENIPNLFPTGQARAMWEPFHPLKFAATSSYYDQIRSGLKYVITLSKATSVCALTQNTDFGKEFVEGIIDEAQADGVKLAKSLTYKPRDTDFTTQILELKEANCGVIALGSLARDTILIYTAARQNGIDAPIVGGSASYDPTISAAPGMSGLYAAVPTIVPDPEKAPPEAKAEMDKFKSRFGIELNATAINALVALDLTALALERAGPDLTVERFVKALEGIKNYSTIWDTPIQNYGPDVHQGSRVSFLCEVKGGKFEKVSGPIGYASEK